MVYLYVCFGGCICQSSQAPPLTRQDKPDNNMVTPREVDDDPPSSKNPFPFGMDMFSNSTTGTGSAKGFLLHQYRKAMDATHLAFHCLIMIIVDALVHMGWCDYNSMLGFKIPEVSTGTTTKPGFFPHWLASPGVFMSCWGKFACQIEARGGDPAMREAMQGLQYHVNAMMEGVEPESQEEVWLVTAHFIMGRLHKFCTSADPSVISHDPTFTENREAMNRAGVQASKRTSQSSAGNAFRPSAGPAAKRLKPTAKVQLSKKAGNNKEEGCPFHGGAPHPVSKCSIFKDLVQKHGQEKGGQATERKG